MSSQVLTKRRVKRRQQRLRLVSKNAKRKVRSVRKHRKTAKKVMRGGGKNIYYGIMYDSIPLVIDSDYFQRYTQENNKINYMLPIFIIVMIGSDLYLFFNKNMTLEEITKILKNILEINAEVILYPPIQLPTVSADNYVVPTYNSIRISNITDIAKITDWSLSKEHDDAPSRQLLKNIFSDMLEDPFQHISKRFIKFKKPFFKRSFENDIYSGEISDTIPLDDIKETSLTKHTFKSPPPNVVTERFKKFFDEKVNLSDNDSKLSYLINQLTRHIESDTHLTQLYKQYIPNEKIDLTVEEYKKPESQSKEKEEIKIDVTRVGPLNESNAITSSDLIAKNVLNSINDYMVTRGTFTPLPPGWLIPRPSADT